ncbi:MAG: PAS domain-containing sensor histidine kinase [Sulfurimonas sp.]|nr:PAS domain-containing sensor histidine kinase [Sulfurimonas sp.]MDD3059996.1 PAS domain-containing sensor histidine kinase [Sulfurimonas sp.]MDD5203199.1 PAS domain-containing sensor histidine kinase [Sulfurimonas sp.]
MLQQYKDAIEKTNIISKTDTEGIITFVNDEFCAISGYTRAELLGKNHNIIRHPDVDARKFKLLWETIKKKNIYKGTVKNRAKNGASFYVNTTVIPILDANAEIVEYIAIRYDVTQEVLYKYELQKKDTELKELNKNLEKKIEEKTKELQELNLTLEARVEDEIKKNEVKQQVMFWQSRFASLGQMLANIAHQWRQPLTELNLILFNIKKAALCDDYMNVCIYHEQSKLLIKNMSNTIEDFTNFFKPNKEKEVFDLMRCINESLHILDTLLQKELISVYVAGPKELMLLGISNELSQVFINLLKNAKDAFVSNTILLREIDIRVTNEKTFARIEIKDNAGGIKEKDIYKIFEPYFTTKHASQGTGLGLFMSKMICEQGFNGSLDVTSKQNATTFCIKIPLESKNA